MLISSAAARLTVASSLSVVFKGSSQSLFLTSVTTEIYENASAHKMHEQGFGLEFSEPHSRFRFESAENKAALNDFNDLSLETKQFKELV